MDDLTGALRLLGGFLQRTQQIDFTDLLCLDARDHAVAVVVDGGERLVELMRDARCHLTHGDQTAGGLRSFDLGG